MRWSRARTWNTVVIAAVAGVAGAAGTATADTAGAWQIVPSANSTANDALSAVTALSSSDVWAAGFATGSDGVSHGLIEHYDGTAWSISPSPAATGSTNRTLGGLAASSAASVWAVGSAGSSPTTTVPLVEQYDGTGWSIATTPAVTGSLAGAATSGADAWAVGQTTVGTTPTPLVEQYDGTGWSIAATPAVSGRLNSVAAVSPADVWAVGQTSAGAAPAPTGLVEHYDGTAWSQVPVPTPGASTGDWWGLNSVSATASGDVWAVGGVENPRTGAAHAIVEHYDGTGWTVTQLPDLGPSYAINSLTAIDALSSGDVWAVGNAATSLFGAGTLVPLVEHYDGTSWRVAAAPSGGSAILRLNGLTDTGSGRLWTVGGQSAPGSSSEQTLTALYQ